MIWFTMYLVISKMTFGGGGLNFCQSPVYTQTAKFTCTGSSAWRHQKPWPFSNQPSLPSYNSLMLRLLELGFSPHMQHSP